jgi:nucleoprotein TPR
MADGVLAVELPVDVDVVALATLVPGLTPDALTADAAVALFRTLLAQALELDAHARVADERAAELERRDVELDQAYQDKEQATKDLEASLDLAQRELRAVRDERDRLGRPRKRVFPEEMP